MEQPARKPLIVPPGKGRPYEMGRMRAIFKADGEESGGHYSVSEWWLEPRTGGPHQHQHPEDHVYYVLAGKLRVCLNDEWFDAEKGSYILIPGGTLHTFQNEGACPAGFITFNTPGGFEPHMKSIAPALAKEDLRLDN